MTCSYNVVFLLDTASSVEKKHLHLGILRILNYLGCKFGLARVRWGVKFFDSLGAQGRTSRVGRFHELGSRSWEDFEEELEARFGSQVFSPHLPGPVPRATLTQNILKETLLDYQWDRPEIASPAKPVLRSHKSKLTMTLDKPPASSTSEDFVNVIFLFSPCPHSQRELLQFGFGSSVHSSDELPPSHDVTEKLIPKGMQEMMANQKITVFWVDTTESMKLLESSDHMGYKVLFDFVHLLGGTILPSETFVQCLSHHSTGTISAIPVEPRTSEPPFAPWSTILPFDSTLNCWFSLPSALQASFSPLEGVLFLKADGTEEVQSCVVTLEPLTTSQRCLKGPVNISLKCTVTGWNAMHVERFHTESWILRSSSGLSFKEPSLFHQFLKYTMVQGLCLVAEVSPFGACSPCTGIFSPISDSTAVLSLLCVDQASEVERFLLQTTGEGSITKDDSFSLPEIICNVLNQGCDDLEKNYTESSEETLFPEWVQQELSRTSPWSPAVMEGWYSLSNLSGASSHLMESFRLLQVDSATEEGEAPKPEVELTQWLSEFYQRKASEQSATSHQQDRRKRCKAPRTPVRQKMKTMPRSLQMLNVARLNVKAQKFHPDGEPSVSERVSQRLLSRRLDDNVEGRGKIVKRKIEFTTEEEMLSYITTNYQKAVIDGENLFTHAQDMVAAVNIFQKSNKAAFMDTIQSSLLKTSKALRQQLGSEPDKEVKVKECQLQVYLRLETCLQCPSLQNDTDGMEQLVEEVTDMLRIMCLTKDPGYLTRFLEEVVDMYMETVPKILGNLYYSLGTQIPPKLASVLPADFFSDDSMSQESQNPSLHTSTSSVPVSRTASLSTEAEQLEELRTRSAKKRKNTLARHRSVTEISQNFRQIEIPQVPKNRTRKDNSHACLDVKSAPAPQKMGVQEVTKVRRNLFNEKILSPNKRSLTKISRSRLVSALEGLKRKHNHSNENPRDNQKLLTKTVAETPIHKQISRRLLHKQIKGRCSDPGSDVRIVEESPEKSITCTLRRSPRIKELSLDRTFSGSFHSLQPSKRTIQQMHSVHLRASDDQENIIGLASPPVKKAVHSPKSLLFGAVLGEFNLGGTDSHRTKRKLLAFDESAAYQTPRKTPLQSSQMFVSPSNKGLRRSPRLQEKQNQTTQKSPAPKYTAAKSLGNLFSPSKQKSKSLPESFEKKEDDPALPMEMFPSPSKVPQVQTLGKQERQGVLDDVFASPTSSCDSASTFPVTIPQIPLNSRERSFSQLQSPRRSLRVAQKIASPACPQKQSLEPERVMYLKPHLPLKLDSVVLEVAPTELGGALSELSPSPKSAKLTEAFSVPVQSPSLPEAESPPNQTLNAVVTCAVPTARTRELSHTPKESPLRPQNVTDISPLKALESASSRSEEYLHLYGENEGDKGRGSISLSDESNLFCRPDHRESIFLREKHKQTNRSMTPNKRKDLDRHLSAEFSTKTHELIPDAIVEHLNISSLLNKACARSLQIDQGPVASHGRAFLAEKATGLQQPPFQNSFTNNQPSLLTASKSGSCAYALRCTPDRRQREAEARLGNSEKVIASSAPQTTHTVPAITSPPTYEVELEMKASGLPKLRIKRVSSMSTLELPSHVEPEKPKAEEASDLAVPDFSATCCGRHSGKLEPASISPPCVRSAHSTPGKLGGGQTYICQSYTPTRCTSSTCSPLQGSVGIPATPSPKHKGKITPEAIKDWPRRKKATVGCRKSERRTDAALETAAHNATGMRTSELLSRNKALHLGEFEFEGVCRLQDESPCSDTEPSEDENICRETSQLKSRKRAFENMFLEEEKDQEAKRSCPKRENPGAAVYADDLLSMGNGADSSNRAILEEEVFSALTPPKSSGKSAISVSGLRALTQSPLLYQGHTTSLRKCPTGDDSDVFGGANEDLSPFHSASTRQHFITRTYSRKRLLT